MTAFTAWNQRFKLALVGFALAVSYAALGIVVPAWSTQHGIESIFWPSSGLALALVLTVGPKLWPVIFLGAFTAVSWNGHGLLESTIIGVGFTVEPLIGAWLMRRNHDFDCQLKSSSSYFQLLFWGAAVAPLSAALAQYIAHLGASQPWDQATALRDILKWWMNDAVGIVMVTPTLLIWRRCPREWFSSPKTLTELVMILGLHFLAGQIVFVSWFGELFGQINRGYWLYLFITWAAVRLGTHGVTLFVWLAAAQGLVGAVEGVGFFGNDLAKTHLSNFWFYNMIVATVGMSIATILQERRDAESQLQLAASVFTHAREGITITDASGNIVDVNETFERITGYSRTEVLGKNPRMLGSGRQSAEFYQTMWAALLEKGHWYGEMWNRRKTGEVYAEMLTISAVRDPQDRVQNYVALFTDITLMKEHQNQLEHVAHFDVLTGLPNRVLLADRLQQALVNCQRRLGSVAIAFVDLDGFKSVNDRFGHEVGDELLIELSKRMKDALREGDTLARIGGDEFVAVLVDLERKSDWKPVINRLLAAAAASVLVSGNELLLSASIGITVYPQDPGDADQMLRHADQAMYQAKQAGKNRFHEFDIEQDEAIKTQRETVENIYLALERDEFVLYYQPKVNMRTGEAIGAEALIRWQHPERGLLPPAAFLHVMEDQPINVKVGEWVIDAALNQMVNWKLQGLHIPVSVNISARQLQGEDFVERLQHILSKYPTIEAKQLELEVLETSAMQDIDKVSKIMRSCLNVGVSFALDDFGTGYSSLTYLRRLPAAILKIDQSFVRDMLDDPEDLAIVQGIIVLARAFGRQTIAEGVETMAHGELLTSLGCDLAQGYGIARPMPASEIPEWLSAWKRDGVWVA